MEAVGALGYCLECLLGLVLCQANRAGVVIGLRQSPALSEDYFRVRLDCRGIKAGDDCGLRSNCGVEFRGMIVVAESSSSSSVGGVELGTDDTYKP